MIKNYRKLTSEEKLLHVIEKPEEIGKLKLSKKINSLKNIDYAMLLKKITLRGVNKALICVGSIMVILFILYFGNEERIMQKRFVTLQEGSGADAIDLRTRRDSIPKLSEYLSESRKNNPFGVLPVVKTERAKQEENEAFNLTLVGIIWSDTPQAIIENSASKNTYLVNEGDSIDKFEVGQITREEVKLISKNGEKILK